MPIYKIKM